MPKLNRAQRRARLFPFTENRKLWLDYVVSLTYYVQVEALIRNDHGLFIDFDAEDMLFWEEQSGHDGYRFTDKMLFWSVLLHEDFMTVNPVTGNGALGDVCDGYFGQSEPYGS